MNKVIPIFVLFLALLHAPALSCRAQEWTPVISSDGNTVTVTAQEGQAIGAIYIKWNTPVVPYEIVTDDGILNCGQNHFLHEFIALDRKSVSLTIKLPEQHMEIYELRLFEDENVPSDVQLWQPPCERADILLVSAHADDEILFMGGIIPTYAAECGARVQVVYMTEFWSTTPIREHEKLDGLWTDGLRTYPVCGDFPDLYAEDKKGALKVYDLQAMTDYLTDTIRLYQPQIVVTHDFNGEYGHGFHQLTAEAVALALDAAADEAVRNTTEIYASQGAWNVPKAYFHLYPERSIRMDLHVPLASMDGMTALEVAKDAYLQHVSQQWCWFYVSDTNKYSCADFGLYRTTVGNDTTGSMLDNIILYDEQERLAREEEERLEQERLEQERLEQERLEQERQEQARLEQERLEQERLEQQALEQARLEQARLDAADALRRRTVVVILATAAVILTILVPVRMRMARRRR